MLGNGMSFHPGTSATVVFPSAHRLRQGAFLRLAMPRSDWLARCFIARTGHDAVDLVCQM
jgi:hypothetical protein